MRKILLILCMASFLDACLCTNDINTGFENSSKHITSIIDKATDEINDNLIPAIEKNTEDIGKQNEELERLLNAFKEESLQKRKIVFLLKKLLQIEKDRIDD